DGDFVAAIFKKLNVSFDPEIIITGLINELKQSILNRIDVVKDGFAFCQNNSCAPGTQAWEDWSTPSRDKQLNLKVQTIESTIRDFDSEFGFIIQDSQETGKLRKLYSEALENTIFNIEN